MRELGNILRENPCSVYPSDVYLRVAESVFHPDAAVSCSEEDEQNNKGIRHPTLLIECSTLKREPTVAPRFIAGDSIGTEKNDHGTMLRTYRTIPTLQEYMMISSQRIFIEIYRRFGEIWTYHTFEPSDIVELTSINAQIPIEYIYEKVRFAEDREETEQ